MRKLRSALEQHTENGGVRLDPHGGGYGIDRRLSENGDQGGTLFLLPRRGGGKTLRVLCEGFDGHTMSFVGRSYAESPDIDGRIYFTADGEVETGTFVRVRITGTMDGELTGELVE